MKTDLHKYIKERYVNSTYYFHVRAKTVIHGRKIESQSYFFFNHRVPFSRYDALQKATKRAKNYEKRHNLLRKLRDQRRNLLHTFFKHNGKPKNFRIVKYQYSDPSKLGNIEMFAVDQRRDHKKARSRKLPDNVLDVPKFDSTFDYLFSEYCKMQGIDQQQKPLAILKDTLRSFMLDSYKELVCSKN